MTGPILSPSWVRWPPERRAKLLRQGAKPNLADDLSRVEAQGRQRIESHTGRRAALAAELTLIPGRDRGEVVGFAIGPNLIYLPDRDAAYAGPRRPRYRPAVFRSSAGRAPNELCPCE